MVCILIEMVGWVFAKKMNLSKDLKLSGRRVFLAEVTSLSMETVWLEQNKQEKSIVGNEVRDVVEIEYVGFYEPFKDFDSYTEWDGDCWRLLGKEMT